MRHHRLFAAAVSVALLLGAGTPAFAKPGKAVGHDKEPAKTRPAKGPKPADPQKAKKTKTYGHLNGGGTSFNGVGFSVQARSDKLKQAHFNMTSGDEATSSSGPSAAAAPANQIKVRCRTFTDFPKPTAPTANVAKVTADCVASGPGYSKVPATLVATFTDNGATGDVADISVTRKSDGTALVTDNGAIKSGDIKVR